MPHEALWHPHTRMPLDPADRIVITRGEGVYLWTVDGHRLLDATSGLWYANIGHGRREIADAVSQQLARLETYHLFGRFANDRAIKLADRLVDLGPIPDAKVFWTSGGSDAVELACKLVRRFWQVVGEPQRRTIVTRESSFHGLHAYGTSISGLDFNREGYGSDSLVPDTLRVPHDDLAAAIACIDEHGAQRIAAVVIEPVMGTGGIIALTPGYLAGLAQACRERGILLIVDEVMNGFGRTGSMFASPRFGLDPDIVLFAKGITSGYAPLGGVLIGRRVWQPFYGEQAPILRHGLTYSGHAAACAAADANLDILEKEDLVNQVKDLMPLLAEGLDSLADHPRVAGVRQAPAFLGGVVVDPGLDAEQVARKCIELGVATRVLPGGVLQVSPPFIATPGELEQIVATIAQALLLAA